ncbi:4'-phosphopantetheinyl transferase family protein [Pseudomonas sp. TE3610]
MSAAQLVVFPVHRLAAPAWHCALDAVDYQHAGTLCERRRLRYLNARIALRTTLAQRLGVTAQQVDLYQGLATGVSVGGQPSLFVSLSYAERFGVLAVSDAPLGVDVEVLRAPVFWRSAVRRCLCASERQWLERREAASQPGDFVWLWTRRESLLKYQGTGIRGDTRCLCHIGGEPAPAQRSFSLAGAVGTLTGAIANQPVVPSWLPLCRTWSPTRTFIWRAPPQLARCARPGSAASPVP